MLVRYHKNKRINVVKENVTDFYERARKINFVRDQRKLTKCE